MDDGALEVTVENGSDVNEVEEQPDDEESRDWFGCCLHSIAGVRFRVVRWRRGRAPVAGSDWVRKKRVESNDPRSNVAKAGITQDGTREQWMASLSRARMVAQLVHTMSKWVCPGIAISPKS